MNDQDKEFLRQRLYALIDEAFDGKAASIDVVTSGDPLTGKRSYKIVFEFRDQLPLLVEPFRLGQRPDLAPYTHEFSVDPEQLPDDMPEHWKDWIRGGVTPAL